MTHHEATSEARTFPICIIADGIEAAVNVGTLFRISDAFGVEKLYLTGGSPARPSYKLKQTSRATERWVAYETRNDALALVHELKAAGYVIACLEVTARAVDLRAFERPVERLVLIVGAENRGVSQALLDASDVALRIPMYGRNSSLNLATACAIAVFELATRFMPPSAT